jgi:hypothetical protein
MFDTLMLREAFRKYHDGDSISDDELIEILRFLEPIDRDGWVLDSRFTFFVTEIREIVTRLRGYMNSRIVHGRWHPTKDIRKPQFLEPKGEEAHG